MNTNIIDVRDIPSYKKMCKFSRDMLDIHNKIYKDTKNENTDTSDAFVHSRLFRYPRD